MIRRSARSLAAIVAITLALGIATVSAQTASPTPVAQPTVLTIGGATATRVKGQYTLTATLKTADGKSLGDRPIEFYERTTVFGPRDSRIGSVVTDSTGMAAVALQPSQPGKLTVVARFSGASGFAGSSAAGDLDIAEAVSSFHTEPLPFVLVSLWLPFILAGFVFATWAALLGVFLSTVVGIRSAATVAERQEVTEARARRAVSGEEVTPQAN
ncbi:MAG: hypothetical protein EPO26_04855 [Chloroflexota bacterium]|nr:MAG: hypothetical protein EPO26_04855 [Chloroflexota bacterium]